MRYSLYKALWARRALYLGMISCVVAWSLILQFGIFIHIFLYWFVVYGS